MKVKWWHILIFILAMVLIAVLLHPSKLRTSWMFVNSDLESQAIDQLSELYKKDPNDYRVVALIAKTLEDEGKTEEAASYYHQLAELRPNDTNFKYVVRFYTQNLEPEKAMEFYREWYDYRLKNNIPFDDEDGSDILGDLYGYALLYQDYELAIGVLRTRMLTFPKEKKDTLNDIITIYGKTGNLQEMAAFLEETLKADSNNKYALETMMDLAPLAGKKKFVETILAEKIEQDQKNAKLWQQLIDFETNCGDLNSAKLWYKKWMVSDNSLELKKQYVGWLLANDQQKEAIKYLESIIALAPNDVYLNTTLVELYEWNNDREQLVQIYLARFNKDHSNNANTKKLLALLFDMKRYDEAQGVLTTVLERYPANKEYNLMMVDIYDLRSDPNAAIAQLNKFARLTKDPAVLKNIGERYISLNRYKEALEIFRSLENGKPKDPEVFRYLGDIYASTNAPKEALSYYQKYSELQKDDYYPHYKIGEIYWSQGKNAQANKELETALDLMEGTVRDVPAKTAEARIYGLLGKKKISEEHFEDLLASEPQNIDIANLYIETLIDINELKKAQRYAQAYEKDFPENANLQRNLARIYITNKDYDRGKTILSSLISRFPEDDKLRTDYAYLLSDMGDNFEAFAEFDKLSKKYPEDKDLEKAYLFLYDRCRPSITPGFTFIKSGSDQIYGPYAKFNYPVNDDLSFDVNYAFHRASTNVLGYNPDYSEFTNSLELLARYSPMRGMWLGAGINNQLAGGSYVPAGRLFWDYTDTVAGRFSIDAVYNKLFDDPVAGLYFDGKKDIVAFNYENYLFDRVFLTANYSSDWYRVNGAKTGTGGGDDFGRQDNAGIGARVVVIRKPEIRLGYEFQYEKLHVVNNYLSFIPLIAESERRDATFDFYNEFNKWLNLYVGGFVGSDPKRSISFPDLYGFNATNNVKLSKHFELFGHYEYSSESYQNNSGRYQMFDLGMKYRF